jgi:hypothetical protein
MANNRQGEIDMIGVNTTYVIELYDDVWLPVWTTDDVDGAKDYVYIKRKNGKRYRIVKHTTEVIYENV